ncbi:ABC transporter permease [Pseudoalteromonas sp. SS15]|uniref:ABC transporter permease n=1 Tax=Pseudoalteromonas sp. SS15 TaxID=3139393 RepID=UPI003BAB8494
MTANNTLFELLCEWRRWRGQYFKFALILFGFAFSAALLAIALRLGGMLFYENPQWTNTDKPLYTVGRLHENKSLSPVSRQALEKLKSFPMVEDVSWLVIKKYSLSLNNQTFNAVNSAVFSANSAENIGLDMAQSSVLGIWLTHRFWQENLNSDPDVVGKVFSFKRLPQGLPVLGVLDQKYDQVGAELLDAWLPEDILQYSAPFTGGMMLERFLLAAPMYYGLVSASGEFEPHQATAQLAELDLSVKGMSFGKSTLPLAILSGVQFDPKGYQRLVFAWQLLLGLVVSLWLILIFTLFSLSSSRAILIADELRTLRLLGAQNRDFFRSAMRFAFVMACVVCVLIYPCLAFLKAMVQSTASYQQYFSQQDMVLNGAVLLSAVLMMILSLLACAGIPLLNLLKKDLFTRQTNHSASLWQKLLSQGILVLQLSAALVAIYTLTFVVKEQWQQYQQTSIGLSATQTQVDTGNFPISWRQLLAQDKGAEAKAILSSSFAQLNRYEFKAPQTGQEINIATMHASSEFFNVLDAKVTGLESKQWHSGVVINHTFAERLSQHEDLMSLLGTQVQYGLQEQTYTITGIVEDIPHWGRSQSVQPTLYLPLEQLNSDTMAVFTVLQSPQSKQHAQLAAWVKSQVPSAKVSDAQTLELVIQVFDQQSQDVLWFALLVSAVIVGGVFSGLWYQIQAQLRVEKQTISVLLAIGASEQFVLLTRLKYSLLALAVAIFTSLTVFVLFNSSSFNTLQLDILAALSAVLVTFALSAVAVVLPLRKLLNQPIQQSLREL